MPETLGYARVSTPDQDIAGQLMRLADVGATRSYQDVVSGRTFERPGLSALLDYARSGDTLMVVRLDRLGRSLRGLLGIVDDLKKRGVALVSIEERIDTSSAAGELVFHVFGAIAQFRAPPDRREDEGRPQGRARRGSPPRPPRAGPRQARRRPHPGQKRSLAHPRRPAGRARTINTVPRDRRPRRHRPRARQALAYNPVEIPHGTPTSSNSARCGASPSRRRRCP